MSDHPHFRFRQQSGQRGEKGLRGLDFQNRYASTELGVVVGDVSAIERRAERLTKELRLAQRLSDGYVFRELRSRRLHLVGDILLIRCHRDGDRRLNSSGGEGHWEAGFGDRDRAPRGGGGFFGRG